MQTSNFSRIKYAYIVGIGRSGTNLLSKLLNKHKNCMVSPEIEFIIFFRNHFLKRKEFEEHDYELICNFFVIYSYRHPMLKFMLDTDSLYKELCNAKIQDYNALTKFIHLKFNFFDKPLEELQLLIDKNPTYTLHLDKLVDFSPEAKFIYMIRDYRANILSRKQSIEYRSPNTAFNCYRWLFYNKRAYKFWRENSNKMFLIRYEDLVNSPQEYLKQICNFLEISDQPSEMDFYTNEKLNSVAKKMTEIKLMKERYEKILSDLEKPVFTDRIEAWKQDLPEKDIKICEAICGAFGEGFGYEKVYKQSFLNLIYIKTCAFPQYLLAVYDYYKEFILYYVSPSIKLKRVMQKNKSVIVK